MHQYLNIINEAFNRPVLLEPGYAGFFYAYLSRRVGADALNLDGEWLDQEGMQAKAGMYSDRSSSREKDRSYELVNGVAILPIRGTLINRGDWLDSMSGLASYNRLRAQVYEADRDDEVQGIFFDIDSPGGAVSGCFDFCDFLAGIDKPTAGFADETAASAAYAIASQLGKLYLPRTGEVGSVGVVWAHKDYSKQQEQRGVTVTLVHAGDHKVDANPYEPLPESVRADVQAELDDIRQLFAQTVANGRGISVDAVLTTEARMYTGQAAVDVGFADAVMSKDAAFNDFLNSLSGTGSFQSTGASMSKQQGASDARADDVGAGSGGVTVSQPVPAAEQTFTSAQVTEQVSGAVVTEQQRIFGIVKHENATGRMATAIQLAEAGMSVEAAAGILATIPQADAGAGQQAAQNAQALQMMATADVVEPETENVAADSKPALKLIV